MADIVGTPDPDELFGTSDADTIDGGAGADQMTGGLGDDTYVVDDSGDTVVEAADEGIDTVVSSVSYSLAPDVENLYLVGDADLIGIGNELGNQLYGNNGNNLLFGNEADDYLSGNAGNDTLDSDGGNDLLDGGAGDDSLIGGSGDDTYMFGAGYGTDTVADEGGTDRVVLQGLGLSDVSLVREGDDVVVVVNGTGERLVLTDWFVDASRVESIEFGADETLLDAATIERIVNNAAPVAADDSATVSEDATSPVTGNVLANDSDANPADFVEVTNPGTYQGLYGTLELAADGSYTYTLDSSLAAVQGLAQGQTLTEPFTYDVSDGVPLRPGTASAQLNIVIEGADEGPVCHGQTIIGTNRNDRLVGTDCDDVIDGRKGFDTMVGGKGDDTYYVDAAPGDHGHHHGHHRHHHHHHHRRGDRVVEQANEGHDTVYSSGSYTLPTNVEDLHLLGDKNLDGTGNSAANWIEGNRGNNDLAGGAGDDLLQGGEGKDRLRGGRGVDLLQGGDGNDELTDKRGSTVFDGGQGKDEMEGGRSADFFAGGRGKDELELGGGNDVIAFNKGDGVDEVEGECQNGVLSLGGGIRYEDLSFRKDGKDLILETGGSDRLVFEDWYKGKHSVVTLQVVAEAMAGFSQGSGDALHDNKVELFDFRKLVAAFDEARAGQKNLKSWALMHELLDAHLDLGSDDAALGGNLAYQYGMTGSLAGIGWNAARETVAAPGFGTDLQPVAALQDDGVKLT